MPFLDFGMMLQNLRSCGNEAVKLIAVVQGDTYKDLSRVVSVSCDP